MPSAQELIDEIDRENIDYYDLDVNLQNDSNEITEEVELELRKSICQELLVPFESRDIYWAQTLIDSV